MKATGIVRRIDDLGRVVIPKEIRRTMRIREGDPLETALTWWERFCFAFRQPYFLQIPVIYAGRAAQGRIRAIFRRLVRAAAK